MAPGRKPGGGRPAHGSPMRGAALLLLCASACGSGGAPGGPDGGGGALDAAGQEDWRYPDPDWTTGAPEDHGIDPAGLEQAAAAADRTGSHCLLVIRDGVLVFERYFAGTDVTTRNRSWSIAKSYTGTLVGIAIARGELAGLEQSVADLIPEWAGSERAAIRIGDLVSMTSGLEWSAFQDYVEMVVFAQDQTAFALDLALAAPPGSAWTYHNGAVQVLERVIRNATGMTLDAYAERHLWSRIGMTGSWARDPSDNPTAYANALSTCRDHARFGYLYLRGGRWAGGDEVVPAGWVAQALRPSQEFNRAYGYLFWLNGQTPALDAMNQTKEGELVPYAPDDLFAARGFGNQFIDVIPSLDLVVVRFGADPASDFDPGALVDDARFDQHDDILRPILEAVTP
jgi:CubicO group peptidase (beta-lactamase class C family)